MTLSRPAAPWAQQPPESWASWDGPPPENRELIWRLAAHLLLAALPLLAISAHVFELVPMHLTAGLVVVPLLVIVVVATAFAPVPADRTLLRAAVIGALATAVYDTIRLDTVYLLGWWGDFIPSIGAWILNTDDPATGLVTDPGLGEVIVGYLWRYVGDGGGIGIWFFVLAAALGLRDRGPAITMAGAITFAVAPVWAGLIATVALAPRADELMFPLTTRTLALSLLGHLVFGVVLGLGAMRSDTIHTLWPWPRIRIRILDPALNWIDGGPVPDYDAYDADRRLHGVGTAGGWSAAVGLARARSGHGGGQYTDLMPPTLERGERSAEVTQLVNPQPLALPPAPPSPARGLPIARVPDARQLPQVPLTPPPTPAGGTPALTGSSRPWHSSRSDGVLEPASPPIAPASTGPRPIAAPQIAVPRIAVSVPAGRPALRRPTRGCPTPPRPVPVPNPGTSGALARPSTAPSGPIPVPPPSPDSEWSRAAAEARSPSNHSPSTHSPGQPFEAAAPTPTS